MDGEPSWGLLVLLVLAALSLLVSLILFVHGLHARRQAGRYARIAPPQRGGGRR